LLQRAAELAASNAHLMKGFRIAIRKHLGQQIKQSLVLANQQPLSQQTTGLIDSQTIAMHVLNSPTHPQCGNKLTKGGLRTSYGGFRRKDVARVELGAWIPLTDSEWTAGRGACSTLQGVLGLNQLVKPFTEGFKGNQIRLEGRHQEPQVHRGGSSMAAEGSKNHKDGLRMAKRLLPASTDRQNSQKSWMAMHEATEARRTEKRAIMLGARTHFQPEAMRMNATKSTPNPQRQHP
jgi:hypothetical protein